MWAPLPVLDQHAVGCGADGPGHQVQGLPATCGGWRGPGCSTGRASVGAGGSGAGDGVGHHIDNTKMTSCKAMYCADLLVAPCGLSLAGL